MLFVKSELELFFPQQQVCIEVNSKLFINHVNFILAPKFNVTSQNTIMQLLPQWGSDVTLNYIEIMI